MNVLLTSVGRRVALARAFRQELDALYPRAKLFGADACSHAAGLHAVDEALLVPPCSDPGYVHAIIELVRVRDIQILVPLIDTELLPIATHRAAFAHAGCQAIVSDPDVVALTRDKRASARRFAEIGFRAPTVYNGEVLADPGRLPFPLFVKPAAGSGSVGATRVDSPEELRFHLGRTRDPVVQSFEAGDEYTIDVFADLEGRARCAVPRLRLEVRAGEISKGRTVKNGVLMSAAKALVERLGGCRGCITLQCFVSPSRQPVFFEANLRFGGGYPLSYRAGANYPRWILEMCAGNPVRDFDGWHDSLLMLRYDDAIFIQEAR